MVELNAVMSLITLILGIVVSKEDIKELFMPIFKEEESPLLLT